MPCAIPGIDGDGACVLVSFKTSNSMKESGLMDQLMMSYFI